MAGRSDLLQRFEPKVTPRNCPACGSDSVSFRKTLENKAGMTGEPLTVAGCGGCGLLYQPEVPSAQAIAEWYEYMGKGLSHDTLSPLLTKRLARTVRIFEPFRQTSQLLDVGCGGGLLLEVAGNLGWNGFGVDVSESCAGRLGSVLGDRYYIGSLGAAGLEAGSFDVIVMSELIEHLTSPHEYLMEATRLLRNGGCLYITTPNTCGLSGRLRGLNWRIIGDEHLNYYGRKTLCSSLKRAGFSKISVWTTGLDIKSLRRPQPTLNEGDDTTRSVKHPTSGVRAAAIDAAMEIANVAVRTLWIGDTLKVLATR